MMDVRFYHARLSSPIERLLARLSEKILDRGHRAVVCGQDLDHVEFLTQKLWACSSFLPHGNLRDGREIDQPLWLTTTPQSLNGASALICVETFPQAPLPMLFSYIIYLYGTHEIDTTSPEAAKAAWNSWCACDIIPHYWQLTSEGWHHLPEASSL